MIHVRCDTNDEALEIDELGGSNMITKEQMNDIIFYRMILEKDNLDNDIVICTGNQIALIVTCLSDLLLNYQWYIADVEYIFSNSCMLDDDTIRSLPMPEQEPLLIGDTNDFIEYVKKIDQFMSGIFFGVQRNNKEINWPDDEIYDTENRTPYLGIADIEIRAFDTSMILVFTTLKEFVKRLSEGLPNVRNNAMVDKL